MFGLFSVKFVRSTEFELFFFSHAFLFIAYMVLMVVHGERSVRAHSERRD